MTDYFQDCVADYFDEAGGAVTLRQLCEKSPAWAANRIAQLETKLAAETKALAAIGRGVELFKEGRCARCGSVTMSGFEHCSPCAAALKAAAAIPEATSETAKAFNRLDWRAVGPARASLGNPTGDARPSPPRDGPDDDEEKKP